MPTQMTQPHVVSPTRGRGLTLLIGATLALALLGGLVFGGLHWWQRADNACNGVPWGPANQQEAITRFVDAVVSGDAAEGCAVAWGTLPNGDISAILSQVRADLGDPSSASDVTIAAGEQMGSEHPFTLTAAGRSVEVHVVHSSLQYRVPFASLSAGQ